MPMQGFQIRSDPGNWIGIRVRKNDQLGTVVTDFNNTMRILTIRMDSGETERITMNNIGPDPKETKTWEFLSPTATKEKWYRFNP